MTWSGICLVEKENSFCIFGKFRHEKGPATKWLLILLQQEHKNNYSNKEKVFLCGKNVNYNMYNIEERGVLIKS